ncbi:MAG: rRNA maturation RNase YbeY [Clostridia bacterium]|jgi:probable rRNA maturation factor|nr:rRNA maturation RNase YbeY [Clostridia bacterium]
MLNIFCEQFDFSPLAEAFEGEIESDCGLSAEIIVTDEAEIRRLNAEARGIDAVTDVLSFPSLDGIRGKALKKADFPFEVDEEGKLFLGSIVICEKRAREQAEEYGHSYMRELHYLAVHGLWHLLGYDHMTEEDKPEMRTREEKILSKLGITRE